MLPTSHHRRSGEKPLLQRRSRLAPVELRHDVELESGHATEIDSVLLDLARGTGGTECVLLPDDLAIRSPTVGRPPEHELLRSRCVTFLEHHADAFDSLGLIEVEAYRLRSRLRRAPPWPACRVERELDRVCRVFRRDLDLRMTLDVQPACGGGFGANGRLTNDALAHFRASVEIDRRQPRRRFLSGTHSSSSPGCTSRAAQIRSRVSAVKRPNRIVRSANR